MSVRVNLLPQATVERQDVVRQRQGLGVAFAVLILLLGLVYWWQVSRVNDARAVLAAEEEELGQLQAQEAALGEFEELEDRRRRTDEMVIAALDDEISVAGVLQDVAAVMPTDAQLNDLTIAVNEAGPEEGVERPSWGTLTANGQSLTSHAPGLERFLLEFDKIVAFHDLFFTSSSLDDAEGENDIVSFTVESELGPEILTERYSDGLPEELR
jgi:Tfp pilus assembly protein PilN